MKEKPMTFIEHWAELRKRLIWCALFFVLAFGAAMAAAIPVIRLLTETGPVKDASLNAFSPWDGIRIYMQVSMYLALIVSVPFILFQLWLFIRPGLKDHERKATVVYVPLASVLLVFGALFGYFVVVPGAFRFAGVLTESMGLVETFGLAQYVSFLLNILLPVSLAFELPVVVLFLTKLRILNPGRLAKYRRHAVVLLLIVAAMITPPDLISALIVFVPLMMLYELSILLSRAVHRRQLAADAAREAECGEDGSPGHPAKP
jgi:sec-independent protein translocase protein TatC